MQKQKIFKCFNLSVFIELILENYAVFRIFTTLPSILECKAKGNRVGSNHQIKIYIRIVVYYTFARNIEKIGFKVQKYKQTNIEKYFTFFFSRSGSSRLIARQFEDFIRKSSITFE